MSLHSQAGLPKGTRSEPAVSKLLRKVFISSIGHREMRFGNKVTNSHRSGDLRQWNFSQTVKTVFLPNNWIAHGLNRGL